jgi:hypothetical protein
MMGTNAEAKLAFRWTFRSRSKYARREGDWGCESAAWKISRRGVLPQFAGKSARGAKIDFFAGT